VESILDKLAKELGHRGDPSLESLSEVAGGWRNWRWWASTLYRILCFGTGMVLMELSLLKLNFSTAKAASLFVVVNILATLHTVSFARNRRISFHFIITYANLLLFGPGVAAVGSGVGAFVRHLLLRKRSISVAMFQMGRFILAAMGAGFVFAALGGRWGVVNLTWTAIVLSVVTYLVIGLVLEALPVLWNRRISLRAMVSSFFLKPLAFLIFVPTSICIFYIYFPYGPDGTLLFLIPVATFVLALELWARSTVVSRNLSIVREVSKRFSTILDQEQLTREVLGLIGGVINFISGVVWLKNPETDKLEARYSMSPGIENWESPAEPSPTVLEAARTGRSRSALASSLRDEEVSDGANALWEFTVPLLSRGEVLGVLSLSTVVPGGFASRERTFLATLAGNVAIAIQNAQLYKQTEELAIRDGLTQVYNHRYLQQKLNQEEDRAKRYHRIFSLIILDIDHFKNYNDSFGHMAGDKLLIALAKVLESSVRKVDFVARYGGEEFAIVLPECSKEQALVVAERIRKNVEEFSNPNRDAYNLTVSVGLSTFPEDGDDKENIVEKADKALYRAKREGRNRVRC